MPTENPLDAWTAASIGQAGKPLRRAELDAWQMSRLRETVGWAQARSPFYRQRLAGFDPAGLQSHADLRQLPLTTVDDLRRNDPPLLCVSQSEISHVVTLETSGTSGAPKRLYFSPDDLEATLDFFAQGMRLPARPGDRVMILFPGERAGSVGDLLARALERIGATPIRAGWPHDLEATAAQLRREQPDVVAGLPVALLAVARVDAAMNPQRPPMRVRSVLLSADHAAASVRRGLADLWGCEVFEHYGLTESGFGGGVDCAAHDGYHLRETELLIEVVDPAGDQPVADGELGEVVLTTLNRRSMPLIRYRTGDLARRLSGACSCGSPLLRLERIARRVAGGIRSRSAASGERLTIGLIDDALFALDGVVDFSAVFHAGEAPILNVSLSRADGGMPDEDLVAAARCALAWMTATAGCRIAVGVVPGKPALLTTGKRTLRIEDGA